ncbi:unnamed protein product [Leptidea sinapis]|uniref:Uncharacterized protein n=1 Tax=Leptidea sinapis TaxID=189913 RepID=A0A5E4PVR7_9NEOP|nr:unnamed protein product [Leptidea sinapis]
MEEKGNGLLIHEILTVQQYRQPKLNTLCGSTTVITLKAHIFIAVIFIHTIKLISLGHSLRCGGLDHFLVFSDEFRQVVGNGNIELRDGAATEICASGRELLEFVQRIDSPLGVRNYPTFPYAGIIKLTANRLALAILFSMRLSIAWRRSRKSSRSCASSNRTGAPASKGMDHRDTVYITGGCGELIRGEIFQIKALCTRINSSGFTMSALFRTIRGRIYLKAIWAAAQGPGDTEGF